MRAGNSIIKRFNAAFQFLIGMVHFLEAAPIARKTTFIAAWSCGNTLRFFTAWRITLFRDSIALVV